jgi:hypothetical protein
MKHELVQLAGKIDWAWIASQITPLYSAKSAAQATAGLGSEGRARAGRRSFGARQRRRPPRAGSMRGSGVLNARFDADTLADVYFGRGSTILLERERTKRQTIQSRRLMYTRKVA